MLLPKVTSKKPESSTLHMDAPLTFSARADYCQAESYSGSNRPVCEPAQVLERLGAVQMVLHAMLGAPMMANTVASLTHAHTHTQRDALN